MSELDDLETVGEWLEEQQSTGPIEQIKCFRLASSGEEELVAIVEGMRVSTEMIVKTLVSNLQANADEYAGVQKYKVYVFAPSEESAIHREHRAVKFFRFEGDGDQPDESGADDDDLLERNAMRIMVGETHSHNRAVQGLLLDANREISRRNENEVNRLQSRIQELEKDRDSLYLREKELLIQQAAVNQAKLEGDGQAVITQMAIGALQPVLPDIAKRLFGPPEEPKPKALPASVLPPPDPARNLIASFTPDQLTKLKNAPFPAPVKEQLGALVTAYLMNAPPPDANAQWLKVVDGIFEHEKSRNVIKNLLTPEQADLLIALTEKARSAP